MAQTPKLNRTHRVLVGIILAGAVVIAVIGFVGSYAAVKELAEKKGFGAFSPFFPIGIDAGIVVLLALDLLLTWLRIPFPLLRQTAWLLTAATIAFNGAAAWGDPLGVGMHAIIPVLFVITVEAARHAIGRVADITADKHMEGVRMWRWLLSPIPTFRLWRRMKLWELRSYDEVITMERDRLVYQTRLRAEYGRAWRRRAPVEELMPLKLARFGVPLSEALEDQAATHAPPSASLMEPSTQPLPADVAPAPRVATPAGTESPQGSAPSSLDPQSETLRLGEVQGDGNLVQGGNSVAGGGNGKTLEEGSPHGYRAGGGNWLGNEFLTSTGTSSAERPRGPRLDVLIPAQGRDEPDSDRVDAERSEADEEPQAELPRDYSGWDGRAAVKDAYGRLSEEEREKSIRKLAPLLAELTGFRQGTIRIYLGEIRREEEVEERAGDEPAVLPA
ncbi:DUF2637 domain-containing protein [Streptomyces xiamenensis]|uniref:DUF2637 domain-containing protein n=1 Tax=Streptomyces xiamenensis TaxID=408015 RepID=UPI0035DBDEA8